MLEIPLALQKIIGQFPPIITPHSGLRSTLIFVFVRVSEFIEGFYGPSLHSYNSVKSQWTTGTNQSPTTIPQ